MSYNIKPGDKYNKLTAMYFVYKNNRGDNIWHFKCDCGKEKDMVGYLVASGARKSCGCARKGLQTHGCAKTRLYRIWLGVKRRCYNSHTKEYKFYGERGIVMCDEWKNNFENFRDWALNAGYKEDLTIERINVNGLYSPGNCKWIPRKNQSYNKRDTRYLLYKGELKSVSEWCDIYHIKPSALRQRLQRGYSLDDAFNLPFTNPPTLPQERVYLNNWKDIFVTGGEERLRSKS